MVAVVAGGRRSAVFKNRLSSGFRRSGVPPRPARGEGGMQISALTSRAGPGSEQTERECLWWWVGRACQAHGSAPAEAQGRHGVSRAVSTAAGMIP